MEEGTLTRWAKREGDDVAVDDLIAEVETDKATMEWRAFDRTVLLKILVQEGQTVAPDTPVAIFGERGEDISGLGGEAPRELTSPPVERAAQTTVNQAAAPGTGRVPASPSVRRLARERGIALEGIPGSGPGGRIIQRDLERVRPEPAEALHKPPEGARPEAHAPVAPGGRPGPVVVPLTSMRRTIARRLVESKQNVPHFYLSADVRVDALLRTRQELNALLAERGE
jgi:pyruvate dehydrogenase E2 component (dihydrolipoamide acetyltransferase)